MPAEDTPQGAQRGPGPAGHAGRPALSCMLYYPGAYDDRVAYAPGAVVAYSSHLYVCIDYVGANAAHNTHPDTDRDHFTALL